MAKKCKQTVASLQHTCKVYMSLLSSRAWGWGSIVV